MNDKLLELVINYENYSSFSESHMQYSFLDLFKNADTEVYCDYIASPASGMSIKASQYAEYSTNTVHPAFVEIRNLRKNGDYKFSEGCYHVVIEFDKCLEYEDEIQTFFVSGDELVGGDFHIIMTCVYSKKDDQFFISSIQGKKNAKSTFPDGKFIIIEKHNDRDELLTDNGRPLKFNLYNYAIARGTTAPVFADEDIITTPTILGETERYSRIRYSYRETRLRMKAHATLSPIFAYKVTGPISFSKNKSSAYEAGFDIGYAFSMAKNTKLALYSGAGVSMSSLSLGVSDIEYSYSMSDLEFKDYTRKYTLSNINEGLSFIDMVIPLYLSVESTVIPMVAVSVDAGVKLYLNTNTKVTPYSVDGQVECIYDGASKSTIPLSGTVSEYMIPTSYKRNTYDITAFGKVGVDVRVADRKYIYVKAGYEYGLTSSYNSNKSEWINIADEIYPFVYSMKSDKDIAVRSFADCISYRRSAITFDLGFRMKF